LGDTPGGARTGSRPTAIVGGLAAVLGGVVFTIAAEPLGAAVLRFLVTLLGVGLVLLASFGSAVLFERLSGRWLDAPTNTPRLHALILGIPLFGTICFLVGLASATAPTMGVVLFVAAGYGAFVLWRVRSPPAEPVAFPAADLPALFLLAIALGLELVVAQLPPTSLDELAYHLRVPKAWTLAGHVVELPLNSHSYFPMGVESASLPLFALGGPLGGHAARLLHWATAVLVVTALMGWLGRRLAPGGGSTCCVVLVATPCLWLGTGVALVEWNLLGVCLLALIGLEAWIARDDTSGVSMALVWAAGLTTKYTFLPFAAIVGVTGAWLLRHRPGAVRKWFRAGAAGLLLGSPFFVRNLAWSGNPIEPFGGPDGTRVLEFVTEPTLRAQVLRYVFDPMRVDESLGAALPTAVLCGLWGGWALRRANPLAALVPPMCVAALALAYHGVVGRILLPFLLAPALAGLVAVFAENERSQAARVRLGTVLAGWLGVGALQFVASGSFVAAQQPYEFFFSEPTSYVSRRRAYASFAWLDRQLPPDSKTLVLGQHELYPSERNVHGPGNSDGARVGRYLAAGGAEALRDRLVRDGFTHVALYLPRMPVSDATQRKASDEERFTVLTSAQAAVLRRTLEHYATPIASHDGWAVYRFAPSRVASDSR
jgi:hypothetical protein